MKIKIILILLLQTVFCFAQNFECPEYKSDVAKWNKMKTSNKAWAKKVLAEFPLNVDGQIAFKYTIKNSPNKSVDELMSMAQGFIKQNFNLEKGAQMKIDTISNICYAEGRWSNVGQIMGLYNSASVNAEVKVRIKNFNDSIIFEVKVPHYILGSVDLFKGKLESRLLSPGEAYPAKASSDHKNTYAQAFINCHAYSLNTVSNFLSYLNSHLKDNGKDSW